MFWLVVLISIWGIIHSWLASNRIKEFLQKTLGAGLMRSYRAFYNVFAVVSFAPILLLMRILPDRILYDVPWPWALVMRLGQGLSALCLLVTLLETDVMAFSGLRPILEGEKTSSLVTKGIYSYVRHPLYLFGLLFLWLTPLLTWNTLAVFVTLTLYIFAGAYFEERRLLHEFGPAYAAYKARTPMIVPDWPPRGQ